MITGALFFSGVALNESSTFSLFGFCWLYISSSVKFLLPLFVFDKKNRSLHISLKKTISFLCSEDRNFEKMVLTNEDTFK
jgi:hypothetical protein